MLGAGDLSGASQQTSQKSTEWDFGFDFTPALAQDTTMSHPSSENEQNNTKKGLHSSPDDGVDADEESWEFKDAFSETGSKNKKSQRLLKFLLLWKHFHLMVKSRWFLTSNASWKHGKKTTQKSQSDQNGALPMSIFGDEERGFLNLILKLNVLLVKEDEVKALEKEIQGITPQKQLCLNEIVEVLQEPKYQGFESEYQLSSKCVHCLLQKDVHDQILSKPQGPRTISLPLEKFTESLKLLGSSARLYKPRGLLWTRSKSCRLSVLAAGASQVAKIIVFISECPKLL
ncbi:hypothetical protein NC653_012826 [Populus alba x Populus x berolinensis]|uniref:Uncharacterized protein n=1 Tax=Populus alba x Populus x berolinensis TaxID=444605 RepID=A0AAD6QSY2_9ROSI|nr:hypothetical protein NC653_012826 [Populus alba x Populus x berolinensis]